MEEKTDPIAEIKGFSGEGTISGPGLEKELIKGKSKTPIIIAVFVILIAISTLYLLFF